MMLNSAFSLTPASRQGTFAATLLHPELDAWQGVLVEIWLTFFLICVVLGTTNEKRKGNLYLPTVIIGFAVTLAVLSGVLTVIFFSNVSSYKTKSLFTLAVYESALVCPMCNISVITQAKVN